MLNEAELGFASSFSQAAQISSDFECSEQATNKVDSSHRRTDV
jgi:hypothetical protein